MLYSVYLVVPGYTFHDNRCCHHLADMNELFSGTVANLAECRSKCDEDDQCLSFEWWGVSNPHPGLGENYCEVSSSCTYELSVYEEDDTLYIRGK